MNKQNAESLEQHFDTALAAPDGIKKLRELILTLAMQGKLIPQDPNDPPASQLLKEIEAEKKRLVKEGKIKAPKPLPEIKAEEVPYVLPVGWEWTRFGDIAQHNSGKTLDNGRNTGQLRNYITTSNLYWGRFRLENVRQMLIREEEIDRCTARRNDLLICEGGEAGRAAVWDYEAEVCFQNHVHRARFYGDIDPYFSYRFFEKLNASGEINQHRKGVGISNMSSKALASIVFPLPPRPEQHRIVYKIDELMARCDELEKLRTERGKMRRSVHAAALKQLLNAPAGDSFTDAWQFISLHFGELYAVRENVTELRKAIFELAMSGRLSNARASDSSINSLLQTLQIEQEANFSINKSEKELIHKKIILAFERGQNNTANLEARVFCEFITKGTTPSANELSVEGDVPFIKVYNIVNNKLDFDYRPSFISSEVHRSKLKRSIVYPGDIVMNIVGPPLGKVAVISDQYPEWNMNQALAVFRPLAGILNRYIYYALSTGSVLANILRDVKGTAGQDNLSLEQCRDLVIPIPCLEEQHRIVAKIDQLLALCDTLEQRIDAASIKQTELLGAMMAQM